VLLVAPFGPALEVAAALAADGVTVRGHRSVVNAATAFRAVGVPAPVVARFERKLGPAEVLLWPPEARGAPLLGVLERASFALVSGEEIEPGDQASEPGPGMRRIPLPDRSGHPELLAYIKATGAREVAVTGTHGEALAGELRGQGYQAYVLGPPRQMELVSEAAV
jgi:hypothetical protein